MVHILPANRNSFGTLVLTVSIFNFLVGGCIYNIIMDWISVGTSIFNIIIIIDSVFLTIFMI